MKKLLVLVLVMTMATMANAALVFQSTATEVTGSQNVTISLVSQTAMIQGISIDAIKDSLASGAAAGGTASSQVYNTGYEVTGASLNSDGMLVEYMGANDTSPIPAPGVNGTLFSFVYHVPTLPSSTYITIGTFADGDNWLDPQYTIAMQGGTFIGGSNFTPVVLHVTPEPMTIGLLSIGGLFLRRRK